MVKVVAEMPETIRAAEITRAIITLRMCLASIRGLRSCCLLCHVKGASPLGLPYCEECRSFALSRSAAEQLADGEGRCRDAGDDQGRRNHESDNHFTHVSFLHKGFEVMLSTLSCKRGIAPRIAVL